MGAREGTAIVILGQGPAAGVPLPSLAGEIGEEKAAQVYRCFVADAVGRVRRVARTTAYVAAETDGPEGPWAADGVESFEPVGGTVGERLRRAFDHCLSLGHDRVIAVDARTPNVPLKAVREAAEHLRFLDLVIGPREGGGAYLVGARGRYPEYFLEVRWEDRPDEEQMVGQAILCGLEYAVLDQWYMVENLEDLRLLEQFLQFDVSEDDPCPNTAAWMKANLR